jgi:anti-sigma factor RsiW
MSGSRSRWRRAAAGAVLSTLALTIVAGSVSAGTAPMSDAAQVRQVWPGPVPGRPVLGAIYLYPGACPAYGACADGWWVDRRPRRRPVAPSEPPAVDQDIWGTSGSPWGYVRRLPPPTAPSQIQPRYRDASTIRPEFGGPE